MRISFSLRGVSFLSPYTFWKPRECLPLLSISFFSIILSTNLPQFPEVTKQQRGNGIQHRQYSSLGEPSIKFLSPFLRLFILSLNLGVFVLHLRKIFVSFLALVRQRGMDSELLPWSFSRLFHSSTSFSLFSEHAWNLTTFLFFWSFLLLLVGEMT